jgi:hypothetical protein
MVVLAAGCTINRAHIQKHWYVLRQDIHEMHRLIDLYLFDYDWEDPDRF